jgi:DNA processing protein
LARGIDSIAHNIALRNNGTTIAVLGCGVDYCYPPENRQLFEKIPENGVILSEYFLGVGPDAINFPKRNRIISGLSKGILVVEAGERSGALITAYYALNQNREVFAIPGNITSSISRGPNRLIKQGAKLVESVEDIFEEIEGLQTSAVHKERPIPPNLRDWERKILAHLSKEPKHIDKLVHELQETPATILAGLLTLELMGLVQQLVGKMFVKL